MSFNFSLSPLGSSNKKAVLGSFMSTFTATIVIVVILAIYILGASLVKVFQNHEDSVRIDKKFDSFSEEGYLAKFENVVELRNDVSGKSESESKEIILNFYGGEDAG
jgi:hypothetical protein